MQAADRLTIDFWTPCDNQLACQSSAVSRISVTQSTSAEWTDHPWSHWSDHPTHSANALTATTVIEPLHMLLQAGVPDPAGGHWPMAAPSSLSRRLSGPVLV